MYIVPLGFIDRLVTTAGSLLLVPSTAITQILNIVLLSSSFPSDSETLFSISTLLMKLVSGVLSLNIVSPSFPLMTYSYETFVKHSESCVQLQLIYPVLKIRQVRFLGAFGTSIVKKIFA